MNDDIIISHLRNGREREAFQKLYRELPKVSAMVKQNGGTVEDAKDTFQEGLIIVHSKLQDEALELQSSLTTFLYSVCRNLWRNEQRKRGKEDTMKIEPSDGDISDYLEMEVKYSSAESALSSLGQKCLKILTLFYLRRESLSAIASKVGLKGPGAVKTRKYKCLEEARRRFQSIHMQAVDSETLKS